MRRWLLPAFCVTCLLQSPAARAQLPPAYLGSWGSQGTGPGQFYGMGGIAVNASGQVLVADQGRVQTFTSDGGLVSQWPLSSPDAFPINLAVDGLGRVHVLTSNGGGETDYESYSGTGTPLQSGALASPGCECTLHFFGIAANPAGDVFITRYGAFHPFGSPTIPVAEVMRSIYPSGSVTWGTPGGAPGQFQSPMGAAVDPTGDVYVADQGNERIQKYTPDGSYLLEWGSSGSGNGQFSQPWGIAVGPNGHVYVTDTRLARVQEFTADGTFQSRWGSAGIGIGQFSFASGIAVDADGNIYVADSGNSRVQKFGAAATPSHHSSWGRLKTLYH